ncbi:ATP-binding cassette domain-containing protein [Sphingomonas sp. Y38-1Y]|uniref:ATP-binding cassette domain-containing protein n=1 Tax=Sphingomonas sp. Y38-1Y TaxID=3078265 RepID=UPI0028E37DEF|nr:ATP-binding cassette domain-containing protein [Sphingomonas sp. Y38-1Y]
MIRLSDVRKVYRTRSGDNVVLDGVGFELAMGERLGVLGRNGAGKSTMVRLISGAERPSAGRVERHMSVSWPLAFGGAFQPTLSGIDNIRFISRIYAQDFERNLAFVADFSELGTYLREPVRSYSSGMRARLAFAISMIIEFDCFLIDEIGAVGDARFHDRCNHELFGKRGDRAMVLISHDPGYLRDHCNRFALLHGGRLALFDDFDEAYDRFREAIGLAGAPVIDRAAAPDRAALIEVAQHRALGDERFRMLVREGDWRRDAGDWGAAEERYSAALALHPYQRSYWVQLGHVAKEGGHFARAEIAYRTACAMGEPAADVAEHLAFVVAQGGGDPANWPIHPFEKDATHLQVPGRPDVEAMARLLWAGTAPTEAEMLSLLRRHATCDALVAALVEDRRFASGAIDRDAHGEVIRVLALGHLAPNDAEVVLAEMANSGSAWPIAADTGAFRDWPLTQRALFG